MNWYHLGPHTHDAENKDKAVHLRVANALTLYPNSLPIIPKGGVISSALARLYTSKKHFVGYSKTVVYYSRNIPKQKLNRSQTFK